AVNSISLSLLAAWRIRSSALGASFRLCVRDAFCCCRFPLVKPLPSVPSAAVCTALFEDFTGTTGLSDFPRSFIIGVRPRTSRCVPEHLPPLLRASASRRNDFSRLNTRPAPSPVNASQPPSRATPHDSEPAWFAKPSLYETFIHYTSPVLPAHRRR